METLRLKTRQPVEDEFENWDDDDFFIDTEDLTFQSHSTSANQQSQRRDSFSSLRSDFESIHGEEEKHVHLPGNDEKSTLDAIAAAARAGIPLPTNVPSSALMGGTIKRLGGRKIKKIIQEDWDDDIELPDPGKSLSIKPQDSAKFPEVLRQVSGSAAPSPSKPLRSSTTATIPEESTPAKPPVLAAAINLDRFRDTEDDEDLFGDGAATIKVAKNRPLLKPVSLITPPTPDPKKTDTIDDDFEVDFELPSDGKLKLSTNRDIPKTPSLNNLDDFDWGEGSLGTRFGGTRRDGRSNRSSSVSALSPSVASSLTAESEDEALDGLVLPSGPLNFGDRLRQRKKDPSPERIPEEPPVSAKPFTPGDTDRDDPLAGLDIGEGEVFDSRKLTLHRNIQVRENRPISPSRPKTAVALKFTSKPVTASRLPRPTGPAVAHDRSQPHLHLEPVSESGGPIPHTRRSLSRLGHSAQSSISSVQTPTTPSSAHSLPPSTPRRREIAQKTSTLSLRDGPTGPTTTSAQLLRLKRSMPVLRQPQSPARPTGPRTSYDRPQSRTDMHSRPHSSLRPKTPVDRPRTNESAAAMARKQPVPFLPAGASLSQSHNIVAKSSRVFRRHDSEPAIEFRPSSRAVSRSTMRSPSPRKYRNAEKVAQEGAWHQLSKPRRVRHFGDGYELDGFDDLPTSPQIESRYMRQPVAAGQKSQLRNKIYQNILPDRNTPSPHSSYYGPYSPAKLDYVPSFARDTAASRIAREASLAQRAPSAGPLAPLTTQRVAQLSMRGNAPNIPQSTIKSKKLRRPPQLKPHLIANLNPPRESKMVNGMFYNPETFRWEGNDNVLSAFEAPASSPSTVSLPPFMLHREKENSTPRPALITNIGATKGVQVVGGMVFDPQAMCWLKLGPQTSKTEISDPLEGFNALDDEEDVFKDIPDLEDHSREASGEAGPAGGRLSDGKDDWLVGEEFDVGPEFVRRQREEEERWRRKCEAWIQPSDGQVSPHSLHRDDSAWKWTIRDIVSASVRD